MKDVISKQVHYDHPINDVWNAISKGDQISAWFIQADFEPTVGYDYKFTHEGTTITGKVITANPVHELTYTWIVGGMDIETTVKWKLEESENGTSVTLEHTGISNYPGESAVKMFENFDGGWTSCIDNLAKYLKENVNV